MTNRILLHSLKVRLDRIGGSWVDELHHVLWAYQTTQRIPIGETSFNLAFETEAVIPIKFGLPCLRVEEYNEDINSIWLQTNLDLIEESREHVAVRMTVYR